MRSYGDDVLLLGVTGALLLGIIAAGRVAIVALQNWGMLS